MPYWSGCDEFSRKHSADSWGKWSCFGTGSWLGFGSHFLPLFLPFHVDVWSVHRKDLSKVKKRKQRTLPTHTDTCVREASPNRTGKQECLQCYLQPVRNQFWYELSTEMKQAAGFIFRHLQKGGISRWSVRVVSCECSLALTQSLRLALKVILTSVSKSCCNYKQVKGLSNSMPRFCHML